MSLIKYAAIVSEARGKESGIIFSRNKYGAYIKAKTSPVNPQTAYQQAERIALGSFAQQWSGLTEAQKSQWNALGAQVVRVNRFGDQTNYTGFNLFVKLNRNIALIGGNAIQDAPTPPAVPALTLTVLTAEVTGGVGTALSIAFTATGGDAVAGFQLIVEATPQIVTGRRFVKNYYRTLGAFPGETSPAVLLTSYQERFGEEWTEGSYIAVRARLVSEATGFDGAQSVIDGLIEAGA